MGRDHLKSGREPASKVRYSLLNLASDINSLGDGTNEGSTPESISTARGIATCTW